MPRNRRDRGNTPTGNTPTQEDEADVLNQIGATADAHDASVIVADEEKVLEAGAVDTESVLENRRIDAMVGKQRGDVKGVYVNVDDVIEKYDIILRTWPANAITVTVTRRTGLPAQWRIESRPKTGSELYASIRSLHGPNEEATYDVRFTDAGKFRGQGRITMPDARPASPPPGQPMQPPYYGPPGQPAPVVQVVPQATDPMAMMSQMFKIFQQMQQSVQQPQSQPAPQLPAPPPQPAPGAAANPVAMMQQMFQMFQQVQQGAAPAAVAQPPQPQQPGAAPAAPVSPTDPVAMMQEMFRVFQQMQQGVAPQAAARAPQQPAQPQPAAAPSTDPMAMMTAMFQMFQQMQQATFQAMGGAAQGPIARPGPPYRGPYRGPQQQPPYYGGPNDPAPGGYPQAQQAPQQPRTAAQEFREAVSVVRTVAQAAEEIRSILPGQPQPVQQTAYESEEDTSPVKVMDVGDYKLVLDKKDGHARLWETGWANMGNVLKWVGEQREAIQKSNAEKPARPAHYVEVQTPGYGTVLVDPAQVQPQGQQPALPAPPAQMPPPIDESPQRRQWDPPPFPGR